MLLSIIESLLVLIIIIGVSIIPFIITKFILYFMELIKKNKK